MDEDELPFALYPSSLPSPPYEILPSTARSQLWRRRMTSNVWARRLDRVNVLGNDVDGHTGCVNALSWTQNGELLISSGDDQQLRVWRMDPSSDSRNEYPFACQTVIDTGHSANVFNAHMLPWSTRIATVAADRQVRVFDVGESVGHSPSGNEMRTKRIITEDSPDVFLTVAEDGQVRQHDLRMPHTCKRGGVCPAPLVQLPHELSTITLSQLTPYQFVVGGESPFAHLFDRRHIGRYLQEEWGMSPTVDDVTTCVRRFSRYSRAPGEEKGYEHITGAKMSAWNGHELLLSFSSDAVYLYSTRDEPGANSAGRKSSILPSNLHSQKQGMTKSLSKMHSDGRDGEAILGILGNLEEHGEEGMDIDDALDDTSEDDDEQAESDDSGRSDFATDVHPDAPVIYPRMRFTGHCNVETVKDVNYLGPCDEYVASGSDDGNFFIWKKSGELVDVLEGDGSVVNVIEGHPTLPLVAVSGIDSTIKLFAPARGPAAHSKYRNVTSIIKHNAQRSRRRLRQSVGLQAALDRFITQHEALLSSEDEGLADSEARLTQCINQ